ncbi:MAG: DALR anticodon-binding domain-containing protein, partial [Alphaproteobacteria bacterium]
RRSMDGASARVVVKFRGEQVDKNSLDLLTFFADRLKVHLKDAGTRHDLIDAVFASGQEDDLLMAVARVEALTGFLETDDGANLLAGIKRAQNILSKEEKNDGQAIEGIVDQNLLLKIEEKSLDGAIRTARGQVIDAVKAEDFTAALSALAQLREPVDRFFESVTVNADNPDMRTNRLKMLAQIRQTTARIADFSRIEG